MCIFRLGQVIFFKNLCFSGFSFCFYLQEELFVTKLQKPLVGAEKRTSQNCWLQRLNDYQLVVERFFWVELYEEL